MENIKLSFKLLALIVRLIAFPVLFFFSLGSVLAVIDADYFKL